MSHELDLNIRHYSLMELEHFLRLSKPYTLRELEDQCRQMQSVVKQDPALLSFIEEAKVRLVSDLSRESEEETLLNPPPVLQDDRLVNQTSTTYAGHTFVMKPETATLNEALQPDKRLDPIETYPTNVSRSVLNTLKRKVILQTLIVNTLFREDYANTTSTDFTVVLPYYFKNVLSMRLSSLQLPTTMYTISSNYHNNTLHLEEHGSGISGTVYVPNGNYPDPVLFCETLQTEIHAQLGIEPERFVVEWDPVTQQITVLNTTYPFTMTFERNPTDVLYKKLGWIMGFRQGTYHGRTEYTSEGFYNSSYPNYLYFVVDDFNHAQAQNVFGMYSKSILGDNILAMVPVHSAQSSLPSLIERKRDYFGPVRIQRMKIQLLNQYGEPVDLNYMDYSFSLEFEVGYDW